MTQPVPPASIEPGSNVARRGRPWRLVALVLIAVLLAGKMSRICTRSHAVVWHKTLQRRLRIVVLLNRKDPAKPRFL